ncbi:MAG: hypothetical protein KIS66_14615 [Fimbriimonadaceae bacterium]|nr:hypothetical protein [Fimbriimonadaceae bacterium]
MPLPEDVFAAIVRGWSGATREDVAGGAIGRGVSRGADVNLKEQEHERQEAGQRPLLKVRSCHRHRVDSRF